MGKRLVERGARALDDGGQACAVAGVELGHVVRRAGDELGAGVHDLLGGVGCIHHLVDGFVELLDDGVGGAGRGHHPPHAGQLHALYAGFGVGGHVGQQLGPARRGHGDGAHLAALDLRHQRGDGAHVHVDAPAQQVGHGLRHAAKRHVGKLHVRTLLPRLADQVRDGAGAGRGEGQAAGVLLGGLDDVVEVLVRRVGIHHQHGRAHCHQGHGAQVLVGVVGELGVQQRVEHRVVGLRHHQRQAITGRLGDLVERQVAAGTGLVLHHDGPAVGIGELGADQPGEVVGAPTRREGHEDLDGPLRVVALGMGRGDGCRGSRQGQQAAEGQGASGQGRHHCRCLLEVGIRIARWSIKNGWRARGCPARRWLRRWTCR